MMMSWNMITYAGWALIFDFVAYLAYVWVNAFIKEWVRLRKLEQ